MDLKFYGLNATPFPAVPIAANGCLSAPFSQHLESLIGSLSQSAGPCLVIGSAGTGKTMLLEMVAQQWRERQRVVLLPDTNFSSRREFLQTLLFELGLEYHHGDTGDLRLQLTAALRNDARLVAGVLLLIDEAQRLELGHLEQLRLLSNVVRDGRNQIQFVLAGTTQLEENLACPELASLNQRVAARVYLAGLHLPEVEAYIDFHWRRVGGQQHPFGPEAVQAIHTATSGIPRLVNQLCLAALELGCQSNIVHFDEPSIQSAWARWQHLPIPEVLPPMSHDSPQSPGLGASSAVDDPAVGSPARDLSISPSHSSSIVQFGSLEDDPGMPHSGKSAEAPPLCDHHAKDVVLSTATSATETSSSQITRIAGTDSADVMEPPRQAAGPPGSMSAGEIRDSTAAQQANQAQALITFAFEADIQKPAALRQGPGKQDSENPHQPVESSQVRHDFERRFDTVQQALASLDGSWDPVDELLIEADMEALVNPLEVVSQTAHDTRAQISTDPAVVFQDHLYLESLWMEDTVWTKFVQTTERGADLAPAALPHPNLARRPESDERTTQIRIDDAPGQAVLAAHGTDPHNGHPAASDRPWAVIDSPTHVSWLEQPEELPGMVRVTAGPFQDDAAIIRRSGPVDELEPSGQHLVHGPQGMDPPVMARRKDLRALLHALRGY